MSTRAQAERLGGAPRAKEWELAMLADSVGSGDLGLASAARCSRGWRGAASVQPQALE